MWDPAQYLRFDDQRSRPFAELLAHVRPDDPGTAGLVVDLGCGPGQLTSGLLDRFPAATVVGVDSSPEMIAEALAANRRRIDPTVHRTSFDESRLRFELGDAVDWVPDRPVDVLVSNATLQWIPGHDDLLARWVSLLAPGGWFAFQVPGNFDLPSHRAIAELVRSAAWRDRIPGTAIDRAGSFTPAHYLERLMACGCDADVWETTYLHVLSGPDPVLEWLRGTALRPVLATLGENDRPDFEAELAVRLRLSYPPSAVGTVFPFRRIFAVAQAPPR